MPPSYRVMVSGNFTSDNGDVFTPQCTEALGLSLQAKATAMVPGINNMIGQDMCLYVDTGAILIASMSSTFKTNGTFVSSERNIEYI